jgi:hypothetical protein
VAAASRPTSLRVWGRAWRNDRPHGGL